MYALLGMDSDTGLSVEQLQNLYNDLMGLKLCEVSDVSRNNTRDLGYINSRN